MAFPSIEFLEGLSLSYDDQFSSTKISQVLSSLICNLNPRGREVIILCIGTDRSTGDSLGPLVGTALHQCDVLTWPVYGTLNEPVHAVNLVHSVQAMNCQHHNPFIIAVDACLGKPERVGFINVRPGAIQPGTALKKSLPAVGDIHISGVVNVGGFMEHMVLQNTRLSLVYNMATVVARGIGNVASIAPVVQ